MSAGAIFRNTNGDVLLVKPTYRKGWQLPGGVIERGESPRAACIREIEEELGFPFGIMRPVLIDYTRELDGVLIDHLEWIFEGEVLDESRIAKICVDGAEISEYRFVPKEDVNMFVPGLHRNRIKRAVESILDGTFTYTDDEPTKIRDSQMSI